jgi:hypothetical protein
MAARGVLHHLLPLVAEDQLPALQILSSFARL